VLFAVLHPPNWIGAFVFSLVASALYLWSGSLALPIIVHAINNAFVALALFAQQLAPAEAQTAPTIAEFRSGWIGPLIMLLVIGASIVAVTLPLLLEARRRIVYPGDATGP
jgi:membrane protease YdiL (CAAX protease family)